MKPMLKAMKRADGHAIAIGYYAAGQRRAIAVTRTVPVSNDATTLLASVERWPDNARNLTSILRWQAK